VRATYERKRRFSWNVKIVSFASGISLFLTTLMWAFKMLPVLIWVAFPGLLLAWGTVILLHAEEWKHSDALVVTLVTVGNAAFYSVVLLLIKLRAEKSPLSNRPQ